MIGVNYIGESETELFKEIALLDRSTMKIFVEPKYEESFNKNILFGQNEFNLNKKHRTGYIVEYMGFEVTNTEIEASKQNIKEVTLQEVADKFGVNKENLRIKN